MKKISSTNLNYRNLGSLYGRAAFLLLFAWCISLNTAFAQDVPVINMPADSSALEVDRITECNGGSAYEFRDDDLGDGLYSDFDTKGGDANPGGRLDTTVFCPVDEWSRVKVVFTEFDLATGDTLFAFQGDKAALDAATVANALAAATAAGNLPAGATIPAGTTVQDLGALVDAVGAANAANIAAAAAAADAADALMADPTDADLIAADAAATAAAEATAKALNTLLEEAVKDGFLPEGTTDSAVLVMLAEAIEAALNATLEAGVGTLPGTSTGAGVGATVLAQSRSGVSDAFGGWIDADCDPEVNASGCLTFIFKTTPDRIKGTGWSAWVSCEDRGVVVDASEGDNNRDLWKNAACDDINGDAPTAIINDLRAAAITGTCTDSIVDRGNDLIQVTITGPAGRCFRSNFRAGQLVTGIPELAVGHYTVSHVLVSDVAKNDESTITVVAPNLVANDRVQASIGNGCKVALGLDELLEGEICDTNSGVAYEVVITDAAGNVLATSGKDGKAVVNKADITDFCGGTVLTATIKRTLDYSNNGLPANCTPAPVVITTSTEIIAKDNTAPSFVRVAKVDTLVTCSADSVDALVATLGEPDAFDNCSVEVTSVITPVSASKCTYPQDYLVTWTATDACGKTNVKPLVDTVRVLRPTTFVDAPTLEEECEARAAGIDPLLEDANARPGVVIGRMVNGVITAETKDTVRLSEDEYICNYILVRVGTDEAPADCGKKYFVDWGYVDWCTGELSDTLGVQFIHFEDKTAPVIDVAGIVSYEAAQANPINLPHFSCDLDKSPFDAVQANDACDGLIASVPMIKVEQKGEGNTWDSIAVNMAEAIAGDLIVCDTFRVIYEAGDLCHTQTKVDRDTSYLVVLDNTLPSAACADELIISLPNEWGARICADDVDAGSYDACGIASKLIRIKGANKPFTECIEIGCTYLKNNLEVEMQVTDNKGNVNTCWVKVTLEDKILPLCEDLENVEKDCDEFHNGELGDATDVYVALEGDLQNFYDINFGDPARLKQCEDNLKTAECGELTYEQQYRLSVWPCGEQIAYRRYRATDWSGNKSGWSEQRIDIKYTANWAITLPADAEGSCTEALVAGGLTINNGACDLLGYEVTDKTFNASGDVCYKIERTYHIINWCTFVAGQDPVEIARTEGDHGVVAATKMITSEGNEAGGYWTYVQVLKIHDNDAPVVTVIDPTPCISGVDFDAEPYGEEDITPGAGPFECDETKTWSAIAVDCSANITWEGRLFNKATGEQVATSNTNEISYIVSNKETYYAEFWAYDNCGNSGGNKGADIKFWDCKKPTPYVLNGIAVDLGETATVQVWASDLNQNSYDNCTDQSNLEFRIWADFLEGDAPTDAAGVTALSKVLTFDCARVGTNVVYIYVMDEEGNWDFAQTYAIVQDNMNVCNGNDPQGGMVAGKIVNANGENVEAVNITVTGGATESMTTSTDGQFQFALATGSDYTVTPTKDINPLNGVSTFDLVLISKHILGINQFDSPYKHIAADVNKSGSITAFDMVQLRQLILNITTEFSANDSWRFVDANHNFASANPASENFNEFYNITALNGTMSNMDFVGVKIGDVNGNAQANSLLGAESRTTNGALTLTTADRFVEAGETVTVAFTAAEIENTVGYQFTMNVAGQNAEIVEGVAKAANFNTNLAERGVITTSWNGEATTNDELFAVTFSATASGLLSELVTVNSDITTAEAYNTAGELMDVNINFTTTAVGFTLAQNTPNPFSGATVIGFNLPVAGTATLTVMDVQGKVLKSIKADYAKGANQVTLNASELSKTGVLYYQLESADNVATKKMIIIE